MIIIATWFAYIVILCVAYLLGESCNLCRNENIDNGKENVVTEEKKKYMYMVKGTNNTGTFSKYSLDNPAFFN